MTAERGHEARMAARMPATMAGAPGRPGAGDGDQTREDSPFDEERAAAERANEEMKRRIAAEEHAATRKHHLRPSPRDI